jgi:hypothetical protein
MPVRPDQDSDAGQHGPHQAVSAASTSGRGPKPRASRSVTGGASPPALSTSTKPPPGDHYARPVTIGMTQSAQAVAGRGRPVNGVPLGPSCCPPIAAWGARQAGQHEPGRGQEIRPHRRRHLRLAATPIPLTPLGLAIGSGQQRQMAPRCVTGSAGVNARCAADLARSSARWRRYSVRWLCVPSTGAYGMGSSAATPGVMDE